MAIEHVPIVLSGFLVPGPDAFLHAGKHGRRVVIVVIGPQVIIAKGGLRVAARLLKPGMRVRGVLDQQLDNHLHAQLAGLLDKRDDILQFSKAWIDLQVVANVVAFIQKRRQIKRGDPDNRSPHPADIAQLGPNSGDVPAAIAVQVVKQGGINLINNGSCMPACHSAPQ